MRDDELESSRRDSSEAILAASRRLVAEVGCSGLTIRAIAAQAGVSAAILYRRFPNKAAIVRALHVGAEAELDARAAMAGAAAPDPTARLMVLCRTYLDFTREHPWIHGLWIVGADSPEQDEPHRAARFRSRVAECVRDGIDAGRFRMALDPVTVSIQVWVAVQGLASLIVGGEASVLDALDGAGDARRFADGYLEILVRGLSNPSETVPGDK